MKGKLTKGIAALAVASVCILPCGTTVHAASLKDSAKIVTTTKAKNTLKTSLDKLKNDVNAKIEKRLGDLLHLDLGDVGQVDVGTWDKVDVNLNNVNVNININLGNITIGGNH